MCLAKGSSQFLAVLIVYTFPVLSLVQPLLRPAIVEESPRLLRAEEAALRAVVEAKLRYNVRAIEHAGVAVVSCIPRRNPREEVVRVAEEIGANGLGIGAHSKRSVIEPGGTAPAICQHAPAIVVMASPAQ